MRNFHTLSSCRYQRCAQTAPGAVHSLLPSAEASPCMLLNTGSKLDTTAHQNFCVRVLSNKCSKIALLSRGQAFLHHFNMTNVFRSYAYDQLRPPPTYTMICRSARTIRNVYQRFAACNHSPVNSANIILVQDSN